MHGFTSRHRLSLAGALIIGSAACGGGGGGGIDGPPGSNIDAGPVIAPPVTCTVPPEGMLVDTAASTNVVGTGTAASCTAAALQTAVNLGGHVRFDCGADPVTIALTQPIVINNVAGADGLGDTVIDGGGKVTLSGGGVTQIIHLDACAPPFNNARCDIFPHPLLTVERLVFIDGADDGPDGGGAIFRSGGALRVIDSQFFDNRGAMTGQDTAGGAIRLIYPTPALIVGSVFGSPGHGNRCSNGGAIGSLQAAPVQIINSVIDSNRTTGTGGNPGNGGNGGGIYHDGVNIDLELCGVTIANNTGGAYGGGIFLVDNDGRGTVSITNSELRDNTIPSHAPQPSHGGAAYLQGAVITMANATVANNAADFASGLFLNGMNGRGSFDATNLTVTGQPGDGLTISSLAGTLLNCTIASNGRGLGGAAGMALVNSIVAGNDTNCDASAASSSASFEFPGASCGATSADPLLGALADHGGTTGVRTMAPAIGSPALGAGNNCPAVDARGTARPMNGCDSGAHQAP